MQLPKQYKTTGEDREILLEGMPIFYGMMSNPRKFITEKNADLVLRYIGIREKLIWNEAISEMKRLNRGGG